MTPTKALIEALTEEGAKALILFAWEVICETDEDAAEAHDRNQCEGDFDYAYPASRENLRRQSGLVVHAALAELDRQGWVVVPKEPTPDMARRLVPLWLMSDQRVEPHDIAEAVGWIKSFMAAAPKLMEP